MERRKQCKWCIFGLLSLGCILFISMEHLHISPTNFIPMQFNSDCMSNDNNNDFKHKCLSIVIAQIKMCILEGLTKHSNQFNSMTSCVKLFLNNIPRFHSIPNKDETKHVLLPVVADSSNSSKCNVVSWGIGNDIEAEKGLKKLYPQCKFYGADPIYESGKVYKDIGDYYQYAVGDRDGNEIANVLENGSYHKSTVKYIGIKQFFSMTKLDFVDYLFMDNEGAEFDIIPLMEKSKFSTTVCQINAELHQPVTHYGINESDFVSIFRSFIINSDFLPVLSEGNHIRSTWLNVGHRKCVEKYFPNYCENIVKSFQNSKVSLDDSSHKSHFTNKLYHFSKSRPTKKFYVNIYS